MASAQQQESFGEGIFGVGVAPEDAALVMLSAPWEATTSYGRGTAQGPLAIAQASVQVDLFDLELGSPHRHGLALLPASDAFVENADRAATAALQVIAAYDDGRETPAAALAEVNERSAWMENALRVEASDWLQRGKFVGLLGGDHSVAYGNIAAHAARHPGMGVLQIDAHADLRVAYQGFVGSHASVMQRVMAELPQVKRLVSVGVRDFCEQEHQAMLASEGRIRAFYDDQLRQQLQRGQSFASLCDEIAAALPQQVYISFDIDGLEPALCPNTGTPVPGGLSYHQMLAVFDALIRSGRTIVGFDLCEVAPESGAKGQSSEWDANVGARVLWKLIGYLFKSQ